ncbi:PREDICTED: calmodulin-like protein 9 [Tarenaya hassleriana]|uniref:calmodulin-like protein 9 n=1 Tax=Tarenaya hassleriana TaxID=28532 RepID=UPI00053C6E3B|nr:PREDICTED: calmodulin-like protein 9 [Tarenaya hassleriana]
MADAFTDEQIQEFYEAFCLIDKDSDGCITMEELTKVMRSMGKTPKREELEEMMKEMDVYGNGGVNFEDFLFIIAHNTKEEGDELSEVFRVFDRDGDGLISAGELGQGMKDMGMKTTEEEAEHMVREADLDGDGFLSFQEFAKMMIAASF